MFGSGLPPRYTTLAAQMSGQGNVNAKSYARSSTVERPVTVDQSYIDQLHAALAIANDASDHNYAASNQLHAEALEWKDKAHQFRNEALYWRDQKFAPAEAEAKALREENAVLLARTRRARPRPRRRAGRS